MNKYIIIILFFSLLFIIIYIFFESYKSFSRAVLLKFKKISILDLLVNILFFFIICISCFYLLNNKEYIFYVYPVILLLLYTQCRYKAIYKDKINTEIYRVYKNDINPLLENIKVDSVILHRLSLKSIILKGIIPFILLSIGLYVIIILKGINSIYVIVILLCIPGTVVIISFISFFLNSPFLKSIKIDKEHVSVKHCINIFNYLIEQDYVHMAVKIKTSKRYLIILDFKNRGYLRISSEAFDEEKMKELEAFYSERNKLIIDIGSFIF